MILLVDDDAFYLRAIERALPDVLPVPSVAEALEVAARGLPLRAVLLDVHFPDGNGLDALPALRAALPGVPILMVTGRYDEDDGDEAIAAGAAGYVEKGDAALLAGCLGRGRRPRRGRA